MNLNVVIPTAILSVAPDQPENRRNIVISIFSTALLIFIDLRNDSIFIGCFTCSAKGDSFHPPKRYRFGFATVLKTVPYDFLLSFHTLSHYWTELHSNLNLKGDASTKNCLSIWSYRKEPEYDDKSCEIFEAYFNHINCSEFGNCIYYHAILFLIQLETPKDIDNLRQVLPFGHNENKWTYQVLFPKVNILDAKLSAFVIPLEFSVWLCILVSTAIISVWLIVVELERLEFVLFWQFAVLLEQDDGNIYRRKKLGGKTIIMLWIFSAVFLRQFHGSSLYTLMTAENVQLDYPQNTAELLIRDDFDLLLPQEFHDYLYQFFSQDESQVSQWVAKLYLKIMDKAYLIHSKFEITYTNFVEYIRTTHC
ncbi:unnamed protein product [Orchesella dallaii]|uniref:Uncharacterized protein n=1 Tax=Orchesella dallaii TaxID=48710 RepID=A0ABP1RMR1_9HEXA